MMGLVAMGAMAQTLVTDNDLVNAYEARTYGKRVSCHDPSVVVDAITNPSSPTYYIYGSHLGRGKTTAASNYQEWTIFKAGEETTTATNSLFAGLNGKLVNFSNAYSKQAVTKVKNYKGEEVDFANFDAHGWQDKGSSVAGNQWAPDIIYNKTMKKWCMYMSLNGDHWCSSIVCLTSDKIEGPWMYQGPVVCSGFQGKYEHNSYAATGDWEMTDLAIATGASSLPARYNVSDKWGTYWPNCIDPCVFYDDDDNLWMSYGSWSGGIFMLKLDKTNGLRDYTYTYPYEVSGKSVTPGSANANTTSDPYFGKKIAGGYYVSGEASYIQKIGKNYFLFMSYGSLTSAGGYQMRVFRSASPTGPYVDCLTSTGIGAIYSVYKLNFGSNATRDEGVKLFGNYQWDTMPVAELAQGHNSAMVDEKGRAMLVYHTRFNDGTEGHQVRVHQLFTNQDGWLVAAPYEFSGETYTAEDIAAQQLYSATDVAGDYQLIAHPYRQNTAAKAYEKPVTIHLNADGTITGAYTGSWALVSGTSYVNLTLNGVATGKTSVTFKGVLTEQTIDYTNIKALCFTALSSSDGKATSGGASLQTRGLCVWGSKADAKAAVKYTLDRLSVSFSDGATLNSKPTLSTDGLLGATVSWKSSDTSVLADDGSIVGRGKVTLTLTVSKDNYVYQKDYTLTIDADAKETTPVYYPISSQKTTTAGWWTNFSLQDYTLKAGKKVQFKFYNYSNKTENFKNWCLYGANATHGAAGYVEYFGVRCDNWNNTTNSNTGCTGNFNWNTFVKDMDGSLVDMVVELSMGGVVKMTSTITTTASKVYNYSFTTTLSAKPSEINLFFVNEGSYIDGSSLATGIGDPIIVEKQVNHIGKWYNLAGQQVNKDYKGVVIVNGKKFVNK